MPPVQEAGNWPDLKSILKTLTTIYFMTEKAASIISSALALLILSFLQASNIYLSVIS